MDNIIEFPTGEGSKEPPLSATISATPKQMLQLTMAMMLQLQASIDSLALLTADVLLALDPELDRSVESDAIQNQQEVTADYQHERRKVLQSLYRELQERFPA
jgi:hypothetical protein